MRRRRRSPSLLVGAADRVRFVEFNRTQEALVGADWLWWFVDETGECFGLLVQAKRLKLKGSRWTIDFGYRSGTESQMVKLLDASTHLGVAAAYVLYFGDRTYRGNLTCGPEHSAGSCNLCDRAGVSVLAGLCAQYLSIGSDLDAVVDLGLGDVARAAFEASIPLEDMADPRPTDLRVEDLNLSVATQEVSEFLMTPQAGARQIAKQLLDHVSEMRSRVLSHGAVTEGAIATAPIFRVLPADTGPYGVPYLEYILRGLRSALPAEVLRAVEGRGAEPPEGYGDLAGIVLVEV
jgi:hypothetical protein